MIGAFEPTAPDAPQGGRKDKHGQEKEDAGNFKPEDASYAAEGLKETADAAGNAARGLSGCLTGGAVLRRSVNVRPLSRIACDGMGFGGCMLAGDAPGDTQADSQGAADGVRPHTIYNSGSDPCQAA